MSSRALTEALRALIEETSKAEKVLARVSTDEGAEALSVLFSGAPSAPPSPAPVSAPQAPESASAEPYDWTEIDAKVAAMKAAEGASPAPSSASPAVPSTATPPAPSFGAATPEEAAFMSALNTPQENA